MLWYGVWICVGVVVATGVMHPSVDNATAAESGATETQRATCQVVTEKLVATASATVTHALKGVCATKDLEKHFLNLRSEVHNEMTTIKILLLRIDQELTNIHQTLNPHVNKTCHSSNSEGNASSILRGPRDSEIAQHNSTIHVDQTGNTVFSYFWRIEGVRSKIVQQTQAVLRSPSFYVDQRYRMYIKLLPHQDRGSVYVHVGLTHGRYDNLLSWPFQLRHRVAVLDQTSWEPQDLTSRVWDPAILCSTSDWRQPPPTRDNDECVGFGFTQPTIFSRDYVHDDSILVRLDVYLQ